MNWLSKRVLPTLALEHADPALTLAYRLWSDRRIEGYLPARCQLDSPQFRLVIPEVQWLDRSGDHCSLKLHLAGLDAAQAQSADPACQETELAEALGGDIRLTEFTGNAMYQIIELSNNGTPATLQLLLLPFADDGSRVSEILVVARVAGFIPDLLSGQEQFDFS